MGVQHQTVFGPAPRGPGEGPKVKYHLISITKPISKTLYQTLCVFSQIEDTKHIKRDLHHVGWIMPQGWDFGALGCPGGSKKLYYGHVAYRIDGYDDQNRMKVMFSP